MLGEWLTSSSHGVSASSSITSKPSTWKHRRACADGAEAAEEELELAAGGLRSSLFSFSPTGLDPPTALLLPPPAIESAGTVTAPAPVVEMQSSSLLLARRDDGAEAEEAAEAAEAAEAVVAEEAAEAAEAAEAVADPLPRRGAKPPTEKAVVYWCATHGCIAVRVSATSRSICRHSESTSHPGRSCLSFAHSLGSSHLFETPVLTWRGGGRVEIRRG